MSDERTSRIPRRGARRGAWLILLVLAVGLALSLLLLLPGKGGGGAAIDAGDAVAAPSPAPFELTSGEAQGRTRQTAGDDHLATLASGGIPIHPGVRLEGPGRLEGRVLDRESGAGVSDARVELFSMPPTGKDILTRIYRAAKFDSSWVERLTPIATAASGAGGGFVFSGVRTGTYFLEARGAWHVPDQAVLVRVDSDGAGGPADVYVRPGGRVLGHVARADGRRVAGAKVILYQGHTTFLSAARAGDFRCFESTTNREGAFVIPGVPPGSGYDLAALGPSFALSHVMGLTVAAGEDTLVDVKTREGATVRGTVLARGEEEGEGVLRPVEGAHVGILPRGLRDLGFAVEVVEQTHAVTDARGEYVIRHAPVGEVDVAAVMRGLHPAKSAPVRAVDAATVEAEPIFLEQGPTVTLRFVDDAGDPVSEVNTSWFVTDFDTLEFEPTFTPLMLQAVEGFEFPKSDAEGVVLAGPFAGSPPFTIFCWRAGYEFEFVEWSPGSDGPELEVRMSRGGAAEGIVMDLEKAEPVTRFTIRTGRRLDYADEAPSVINPFSGGLLVEDPNGRFKLERLGTWPSPIVFTAPGYVAEEVEIPITPGQTTRGVIVKMRRGGTIRGRVVDREGAPVAGAQVAAMDERGRPVAGSGRNPRGNFGSQKALVGQEIAMGSMELFSGLGVLGSGFVVSEADGSFELTSLPEMAVAVHAAHRDYADAKTEPMEVVSGDPIEGVEIEMSAGGGIFGSVRDRFGQAVPGALVLVFSTERMANTDPSARWVRQAGTDEEGSFRIEHMEPGGYFLACTRGDEGLNLTSFLGTLNFDLVSVPPEQMIRYDITDSSASAVRVFGRVRASGDLVRSGGVFALGFESENVLGLDVKIAQVHPDGTYEFEGLAPGSYTFTYQGDGPEVRVEVEIPDVPEHRLDLDLPEGGVRGNVRDALTGEPVRRAEVVLTRMDSPAAVGLIGAMIQREGRAARDWTNAKGEFEFERLQAGDYSLRVGPPRWGGEGGRYGPPDPLDVEVAEGLIQDGIEVRLTPSLELRGVVLDGAGFPVQGARVYAFAHGDRDVRPSRDRTDSEGRFVLRSLAPGAYDVTASAEGLADAPVQEIELGGADSPEIVIELRRGVEVVVRVRDAVGSPVQGATGRLVPLSGSGKAAVPSLDRTIEGIISGEGVSGPDGLLDLGRHSPGRYRLEVGRGTQSVAREPILLEEGVATELDVELK